MDVPLNQRSRSDQQQLSLLGVIVDISGTTTNGAVQDVQLASHPEVGYDLAAVRDELRALGQKDYVMLDERLTGPVYATPLRLGIAEWSAFASQRSSVIDRRIALRDEYLRWLYEEAEVKSGHPSRDDFQKAGRTYFGLPYTDDDTSKTGAWLKEEGFIGGQGSWGAPAPLYPTLTPKGRSVVENGRTVSDVPQETHAVTNYNSTYNGPANVAQGNRDVQQTMTVQLAWQEESRDIADAVEQALPALHADVREEVNTYLSELRTALAERPTPGKVRRILTSLGESLAKGSAGALGKLLVAQVVATLSSLPS